MKFNHLLTKIVPTKSILFVNSLIQERKEEWIFFLFLFNYSIMY
jgi:hypothetical protein